MQNDVAPRTTIVALASAGGAAERAVIRISGPRAAALVLACCTPGPAGAELRLDRRGIYPARFDDGEGAVPVLLLWMPGPRSFTAEDVVELHVPGHPELVDCCLARLRRAGADFAEPGEFTRRAFENGRIDLTQAEGIAALVTARSRAERRAATALLTGGLARRIARVRDALESVRALTEASLDFDEADTGHVPFETIESMAAVARSRLAEALGWEVQRARGAGAPIVVLAGAPNAGKSTLFNRLATGEVVRASGAALVSDLAGTTRDAKRGEWALEGDLVVDLIDTAGRFTPSAAAESPDARVDALADRRARDLAAAADIVVWVVDASVSEGQPSLVSAPEVRDRQRTILVWNKVDVAATPLRPPASFLERAGAWVRVSGDRGEGLDELIAAVRQALTGGPAGSAASDNEWVGGDPGIGPSLGAALGVRHRDSLRVAEERVEAAIHAAHAGSPLDLVAEELKLATEELDAIDGRTTPEGLLDRIFAQFCLGK